jgi:pyruvate/2-oxoglutarate dehydrogenase complex dihydrolipoamide acyltransferase (E2) component
MMRTVKVPTLDTNIEEVTLTGWLKREGDRVRKGDPLVEMTTEKAAFELEAPAAGVLRKILAREKSVVPVGYVVALIGGADEELPDVSSLNRDLLARGRARAERRVNRPRRT